MKTKRRIAKGRHEALLKLLGKQKRLSVEELVRHLGASTATVRRDLQKLESEGMLVRTHGGAVHADALGGEVDFHRREREKRREKRAIGAAAHDFAGEGGVFFLDSGSTCLQLARRLMMAGEHCHLFTNSLPVLELGQRMDFPVTMIGGRLRRVSQALVGSVSLGWISRLHFDVAFVGASGISAENGFSTTELDESAVKEGVLSRASRRIVLADSGKWERPAAIQFANWKGVDCWVTDEGLPGDEENALQCKFGLEVVRASLGD